MAAGVSGGSLQDLRRSNQHTVMTLLMRHGPMHRASLARHASLSRTTISTIVNDLITRGILLETGSGQDSPADGTGLDPASRRVMLRVNPTAGAAIGISLTDERICVHLADLTGQPITDGTADVRPGSDRTQYTNTAVALVQQVRTQAGLAPQALIAAGIGVPRPIEGHTGIADRTVARQRWTAAGADELRARLGIPVSIEDTARLETLAEARWGAGRGVGNLFYIGLSGDVGAGFILDRRLYRGSLGAAGALGHVSTHIDGPACGCGNRGCLALYATTGAVAKALRDHFGGQPSIDEVLASAAAGDRACLGVIADTGRVIGTLLANVCNLLNPDRIVVGGELAQAGETLLAPMREAIARYALSLSRDVAVVPSELAGRHAAAMGGAALVLDETPNLADTLGRLLH